MREKVYIVGGSGFVGKHLSVSLSDRYEVSVIDRAIDSAYFKSYPAIKTIELDLINNLIPEYPETPEYIINLASPLVTAARDLDNSDKLIADNISILTNLFLRFRDRNELKLFIQFGSIEEYGNGMSPFVETQREIPNSMYAVLKQAGTNFTIMLHANFGFPAMVVRPGNLFGLYQDEQRFIPYVLKHLIENKPVKVTLCEQRRDFIYINDFAAIIERILTRYNVFRGEIVNVSSGESIQLKDIAEQMKRTLNSSSEILYGEIPYRENEPADLKCCIQKLELLLEEKISPDTLQSVKEYVKEAVSGKR
jgi:UDP-glucose 4-epimerase